VTSQLRMPPGLPGRPWMRLLFFRWSSREDEMNRLLTFSLLLLLLLPQVVCLANFQTNGQLQVQGTNLVNQYGQVVQLKGMSTHGLQWYGWGDCVTEESLDTLAYDWNSDLLRVSMYVEEGGYNTNPTLYRNMVDTVVNEAYGRGMYAIIDWHMLSPGDPLNSAYSDAASFFDYMSRTHGNKGNVLYEIANEPSGVSWSRIKSYAEGIIPVIRANDPDGIILVGTPDWSSLGVSGSGGPSDLLNDRLSGSNIMYTYHFYAASHGSSYRSVVRSAADQIPIFVSEWGSQTATGGGSNDWNSTLSWINLMDEKKLSWANWNYADDFRSGSVWQTGTCSDGPWTDNNLKEAGRWVKDWIMDGSSPTPDPTPDPTPGILYGDVSENGDVSAYDASLAAQYAVGLISLSSDQITKADVTGNGDVSATDASWIARKAVDASVVFPVE